MPEWLKKSSSNPDHSEKDDNDYTHGDFLDAKRKFDLIRFHDGLDKDRDPFICHGR